MELLTELFPYQQLGVDKLLTVKVGALYMEMGTGKTRTTLELIKRRLDDGKIEQVLWLCPYSVVKDLPELLSEHVSGFMEICKICGIESLSASSRINAEVLAYVQNAATYLIVDESLLIKNPQAYRTQNIIRISKACQYKLILNGTMITRSIEDLFAQWFVLDWRILGYSSYWSFSANHLEFDPARPGRLVRAHNTEYLTDKISPYTYEVSKKDVLDLPEKKYVQRYFNLTLEQEQHYEEISGILLQEVNELRPETIYRLFGALQSITSGFAVKIESGHITTHRFYTPLENPRIRALLSILDEIGNAQAVIYCKYTQEILDIIEILGDKAVPFYGEQNQAQRQENKNKFKGGKAQYLICNKSCAQFGLNLQFCRNVIFYNNDWDWATRAQAEDRAHRFGQIYTVTIYDIIANDTIDKTIEECLRRKESLSNTFKRAIKSKNALLKLVKGE